MKKNSFKTCSRLNKLKFNKLSSIFLGLFIVLVSIMPVFASSNVISSVMITNSKDDVQGYELDVDSTQVVSYKTKMVEDNGIIFELKNSSLSKNPSTLYDDVVGIDSVVVKQEGKNKVQIYIQGENAQNTELVFSNQTLQVENNKSVIINHPINHYQPTNHLTDLDEQANNQDWDDNSFNITHLISAILTNLKEGALGIVSIFALVFVMILAVFRAVANKYAQEKDPLIGLNNVNSISAGVNLNQNLPSAYSQSVIDKEDNLENISSRSKTIIQAQKELEKAHLKYQEYLQDKYKNNSLSKNKKTANIDPIRKGIALNQYQKSTKNPYSNQEVLRINEDFSRISNNISIPPRPKREVNKDFTSPYIQRKTNKVEYNPKPQLNKKDNSMRFLESVSKIYEQSGRGDLANGLKNSMTKAKHSMK